MRRASTFIAFLLGGSATLCAQPRAPDYAEYLLRTPTATVAADASPAITVNPASREEVRQFYRAVYNACDNVPMGWTGSYATGAIGDTNAAFKDAVRLRINFFRALAGVPAVIVFNSAYSGPDQSAALMMSANTALQHTGIPPSWKFYTPAGATAAANSNLALGLAGPDAINGYIADNGSGNDVVGHRRWLLYPQTREMGTGDVPGNGTYAPANAIWVLDGLYNSTRPATRTTEVPYPNAGYIPYQLVWPRWSFSYPGADFSAATVTMTRGTTPIAVRLEPGTGNIGEPTLVWVYNNLDAASATPHPRPGADTTYTVNVNTVRIGGVARNFSYNVTVFDPDVPGGDFTTTTISGSSAPPVGTASTYAVAKPAFADGFQFRTVTLSSFAKTYGAEAGLDGLLATTTSGYATVQTVSRSAGTSAYYLAHPSPRADQILLLPETFYVRDATAAVTFSSRLGYATAIQVARVQASTDDGGTWTDVYAQAGTGGAGEAGFTARRASLTALAGRTVRVRLNYSIDQAGNAFPQADPSSGVGWYIDNLTLTGVQTVSAAPPTSVASGNTFTVTPTALGALALQARGQLFGAYPLEWGPITQVSAVAGGTPDDPGRLINLAIRSTAGTGAQTLIVGLTLGGSGTGGNKPILIRAAGPALTALGVAGVLADPKLDVVNSGGTVVASNDNWGAESGIAAIATQVGAFPFTSTTSKDAALYRNDATFAPGGYSVKVTGAGTTTGIALAEIYDATPRVSFTATTPRLTNLSARTQVGTGGSILIAGLTVGGSSAVRVIIRAIGPGLTQFGLAGVLADPQLEVFDSSGGGIAGNDNWDSAATLADANSVGAFQLTPGSKDAVLVTWLQPGGYTVQISGVGSTTGIALVEVYELP